MSVCGSPVRGEGHQIKKASLTSCTCFWTALFELAEFLRHCKSSSRPWGWGDHVAI